ncbi:MAG: anthranilate synthase component I, partial [Verrucomicrobiae bacterium]|nr:anthranilate synthase component I [Verrucomicrobiae bacterium]
MYSPTKTEFVRLASKANLIPVTKRVLADFETPLSAYAKIRGHGESFLFESVEGGEHIGRYSFLGSNPRAVIVQFGHKVTVLENHRPVEEYEVLHTPAVRSDRYVRDGLEVVERILRRYQTISLP